MRVPADRHRRRPIRPAGIARVGGWRVKLYTIVEAGLAVTPEDLGRLRRIAGGTLPRPAVTPARYGVAFATLHLARRFDQIVVDWWAHENELRHRVFKAVAGSRDDFRDITATGEAFCVWELRVIGFEREAWLSRVLEAAHPDPDAYLRDRLSDEA